MSTVAMLNPALFNRPTYQRDLRAPHVARMAQNWNDSAVGAVTVSKRDDGSLWVMDGGHRSAAAVQAGVPLIPAIVKTGLSLADEAALFLELNEAKALSAIDKYIAAVIAGIEPQASIDIIVRSNGWKVRNKSVDGAITAPAMLEFLYRGGNEVAKDDGARVLDTTLSIITEAWGRDTGGTSASMLRALGRIVARYGDGLSRRNLVKKLRATTPAALTGQAHGLAKAVDIPKADALGKLIIVAYNKQLQSNRLPEWEIRH